MTVNPFTIYGPLENWKHSLLSEEICTPDVFYGEFHQSGKEIGNEMPERRLMLAVLEEGIHTLEQYVSNTDPNKRRTNAVKEAENWLESTHSADLYSFESICNILRIDVQYLRDGIKKYLATSNKPRVRSDPRGRRTQVNVVHERDRRRRTHTRHAQYT